MEKLVIWSQLQLKLQAKRIVLWVEVIAMILLTLLVLHIHLPDNTNVQILLYSKDGDFAELLMQRLEEKTGLFVFQRCDSQEKMRQEILAGKAECGFVLKDGMEEKIRRDEWQDIVVCISSGGSNKTSVVCETFYQEMFSLYSEIFLEQQMEQVVEPEQLEEVIAYIKEQNSVYIQEKGVFDIVYEGIETVDGQEKPQREVQTIRGLVAVIIFLNMLIVRGEELAGRGEAYIKNLPQRERKYFLFCKYFMSSVVLAILSIIVFQMTGIGENIFWEAAKMIVFLAISAIWIIIVGGFIKKGTTYYGWICPIVVINLLLPPVFLDLVVYIPAIETLNWLLPIGIYLKMFV